MNLRLLARVTGLILAIEALFMATSIAWAVADADFDAIQNFLVAAGLTGAIGLLAWQWGRKSPIEYIHAREAVATVTIVWLAVGLFGALPYLLERAFPDWPSAVFESVSGFTTTGASAFTDVESLSRALLWWRALTHWLGGMGIIVMFIAIFPRLGLGAVHLFRSETAGPITEKLRPRLRHTSLILWYIYIGLTFAEVVMLWLFGLTPFEALTHSFATIATGGFSSRNLSVGGFDSLAVEMTVLAFMVLAGINFGLYYRVARGEWRDAWRDPELRAYLAIMTVAVIAVSAVILPAQSSLAAALRHGSFSVVTANTETGFVTDDFDKYPDFARLLIMALMIIGGCAGSTSGGIKVARIVVAARAFLNDLVKSFRPHAVLAVRVGGTAIDPRTVREVALYIGAYLALFLLGSLVLTLMGVDMTSSLTASISCLGGCGPGLGAVGPMGNYAFVPAAGKLLLALLMILGRLEILTVLALAVPAFWRK